MNKEEIFDIIKTINERNPGAFADTMTGKCDYQDYDLVHGSHKLIESGKLDLNSKVEIKAILQHTASLNIFKGVFPKTIQALRDNGIFEENNSIAEWAQNKVRKYYNKYYISDGDSPLLTNEGLEALIRIPKKEINLKNTHDKIKTKGFKKIIPNILNM